MFRLILRLVASLERTSLRMDIVEMLSDLKFPSPLLKKKAKKNWFKMKTIDLCCIFSLFCVSWMKTAHMEVGLTSSLPQAVFLGKCSESRRWCFLLLGFSQAPQAGRTRPMSGSLQNWTAPPASRCSWAWKQNPKRHGFSWFSKQQPKQNLRLIKEMPTQSDKTVRENRDRLGYIKWTNNI